jgi:hypothetical protein
MPVNPALQLDELAQDLAVDRERPAQLHERAHDRDVHVDRLAASRDAGEHGHALLGKRIRQIFDVAAALQDRNL